MAELRAEIDAHASTQNGSRTIDTEEYWVSSHCDPEFSARYETANADLKMHRREAAAAYIKTGATVPGNEVCFDSKFCRPPCPFFAEMAVSCLRTAIQYSPWHDGSHH